MTQKLNQIVVTGPVNSAGEQERGLYLKLREICFLFADMVYTPLETAAFEGTVEERYHRAIELILTSDLLIAEVSNPSTGQGMELQEAARQGVPIICLARAGARVSSMVAGCPAVWQIITYHMPEQIPEALVRELGTFCRERVES